MLKKKIPSYFTSRRQALIKNNPSAAFLFPGHIERPYSIEKFRQESSFFYLTGFDEPSAFLVLTATGKSVLFVQPRDPERELWDGERYGPEGAVSLFGFDEAYPITELDKKVPDLIRGADQIYYRLGLNEVNDRRILGLLENVRLSYGRSGRSLQPVLDPNTLVGEMRLFKSSEELELLRKATQISALAHRTAQEQVRPGMNEAEVEALLTYVMQKNGCIRQGYSAIVGAGRNSTCLHYRFNNGPLQDGELLLIDAGGEYEYFTADITRTFPVSKVFTAAQARIYDLVLKAQKTAIDLAKPGTLYSEFHNCTTEIITEGLLSLGLLKGKKEELLRQGGFKRFFPHGTGHFLGMDVHDVGLYVDSKGEPRKVEAGMVFTIEPGIYFQPTDTSVPDEYRNIGVRIEDDIAITPTGHDILTCDAPKERVELEAIRAKAV